MLKKNLPERLWWIDHLKRVHGVRGLEAARRETFVGAVSQARYLSDLKDAKREVADWADAYRPEVNWERVKSVLQAAQSGSYRATVQRPITESEQRLLRLLFVTPLPQAPPAPAASSEVSDDEFWNLVEKDQRETTHAPPY